MIFWVLLIENSEQVINFQIFKLILRTSYSGLNMHFWVDYPFMSIKTIFLSLITIFLHCSLTDFLLDFYGTIFLNILNNSWGHIISHKKMCFCNLSCCMLRLWNDFPFPMTSSSPLVFQLLFSNHTLFWFVTLSHPTFILIKYPFSLWNGSRYKSKWVMNGISHWFYEFRFD